MGEADLAEAALDSIFQAIATINDMTYQIASAAEEQSSVSRQSLWQPVKTNALANDIAQDATNTAKASQALRQAAERLQQVAGAISSQLIIFIAQGHSGRVRFTIAYFA